MFPFVDITEKARTSLKSISECTHNITERIVDIKSKMQITKAQIKRETANAIRMIQMNANRTCELVRKHEKQLVQKMSSDQDKSLKCVQECQDALEVKQADISSLKKCSEDVDIDRLDGLTALQELEGKLKLHESQPIQTINWSLTERNVAKKEPLVQELVGSVTVICQKQSVFMKGRNDQADTQRLSYAERAKQTIRLQHNSRNNADFEPL